MEMKELSVLMQQNGIVGAGGAGFPTYAKLNENADTIILNCAECEPLLRLHRQLLEKYAQEIVDTFHLIGEAVGAKEVIIGIKKAYTRTIEALNAVIGAYPEVRLGLLDEVYPAGDEVVLIYEVTGKVVRPGGLPIECGVAVFNVETVYNVYRAMNQQTPVMDKLVSCRRSDHTQPGVFYRRPDDGIYRKRFPAGNQDDQCGAGASGIPLYHPEETAEGFYRPETGGGMLLPVQYVYGPVSEKPSGPSD